MKKINWPIWLGFLICVVSAFSYPFLFVNWEVTRDFPWANLVLFAIAAILLFIGLRRAFSRGRWFAKTVASVLTVLSVLVLALFIFGAFIAARWLPASAGAPQVNQKAPDFSLTDTNNNLVSLTEILHEPIDARPPKGVLLIFYRGYW